MLSLKTPNRKRILNVPVNNDIAAHLQQLAQQIDALDFANDITAEQLDLLGDYLHQRDELLAHISKEDLAASPAMQEQLRLISTQLSQLTEQLSQQRNDMARELLGLNNSQKATKAYRKVSKL